MTAASGTAPVAVVTGAGGGIGLATVERLRRDGYRVIAADLVTDRLADYKGDKDVRIVACDLSQRSAPAQVIGHASDSFGRVDAVVNNLGVSPQRSGFLDATDDDWTHTLEVNLMAAVRAVRAALPLLLADGGVIVNVTSVLAKQPIIEMPDYTAAKAGLGAVTMALSQEFASQGVRVLSVAPGPTLTGQWTDPGGQLDTMSTETGLSIDQVKQAYVPQALGMSLGRMVEPAEVADVIAFALSPMAGAMTGCELLVDGGMRTVW